MAETKPTTTSTTSSGGQSPEKVYDTPRIQGDRIYNRGDYEGRVKYANDHGLYGEYAERFANDTGSQTNWQAPWYDIFGSQNREYIKGLAEYDSNLLSSLLGEQASNPENTRKQMEAAGYNPAVSAMNGDSGVVTAGTEGIGSGQTGIPEGGISPSATSVGFGDSDAGKTAQTIGDLIGVAIGAYGGIANGVLALSNAEKVPTEIQKLLSDIDANEAGTILKGEQSLTEQWNRLFGEKRYGLDLDKFNYEKYARDREYGNERQHFVFSALQDLYDLNQIAGTTPEVFNATIESYSRLFGSDSPEAEFIRSAGQRISSGNGLKAGETRNAKDIAENENAVTEAEAKRPYIGALVKMAVAHSALQLQQMQAETKFKSEFYKARSGKTEGELATLQAQYESSIAQSRAKYEEASVGLYAEGLERLQRLSEGCPLKSDFANASDFAKYKNNPSFRQKCQSDALGQYLMLSNNAIGLYGAESNKNKIKYDAQANMRGWADTTTNAFGNILKFFK